MGLERYKHGINVVQLSRRPLLRSLTQVAQVFHECAPIFVADFDHACFKAVMLGADADVVCRADETRSKVAIVKSYKVRQWFGRRKKSVLHNKGWYTYLGFSMLR